MLPMAKREGYFGEFGGRFVSELLIPALDKLWEQYKKAIKDPSYKKEYQALLHDYAGRPTHLYFAANLSAIHKARIYLKREDTLHTGSHKINNTLGQALLARRMGKKRVIAETGAGQHGVATATAAAVLGLKAHVYMGEEDLRRQALNGFRMRLLGSTVEGVGGPTGTLRDAVNEALRDWSRTVDDTHYIVGSAIGPHPFPRIVRDFQSVIGKEARKQILAKEKRLPDMVSACVGGGSNAIGMFSGFVKDNVVLLGAEAGGRGDNPGQHSSSLSRGVPGILQGARTYLLQDSSGIVSPVHSVSAGLDYPGVGPEHAYLKSIGRAEYVSISDEQALEAFRVLSEVEGIIPALESSHAVAAAFDWINKARKKGLKDPLVIINLSGRGDKDVAEVQRILDGAGNEDH